MLVNRNAMLVGGIRPHMYCLPILKTEEDRKALLEAVRVCDRIFIGTDSAPHAIGNKENSCGCAGCYSAHAALELYAEAFEKAGMLQRLEAFCSINGPAFYGVAPNTTRVTHVGNPAKAMATAGSEWPCLAAREPHCCARSTRCAGAFWYA